MKKHLFFLITLCIATALIAIESNISSVTVYNDRALVTRTASAHFTQGVHTVTFDVLPTRTDLSSIQIDGTGNAVICDVTTKSAMADDEENTEQQALQAQMDDLKNQLNILRDAITLATNEKKVISDILTSATTANDQANAKQLNPEEWIKLVDFYHTKHSALDTLIREKRSQEQRVSHDIRIMEKQIKKMGYHRNKKQRYYPEVTIEASQGGTVTLDLTYMVRGPQWHPMYDLRVDSQEKTMTIEYKATVTQSTGEDWNNVTLSLSTARPNIGAEPPELSPQYVVKDQPVKEMKYKSVRGGRSNEVAYAIAGMQATSPSPAKDVEPELVKREAQVSTGATAVEFNIIGSQTILSDSEPLRVTITRQVFAAGFRYSTVPKTSTYAYLKAKVKNDSEYPFLAGTSNVFLDNHFVTKSSINAVSPGQEFWTFLGVDEGISVEYKYANDFSKFSGLLNKSITRTITRKIIIKNNKKTREQIVVWDQYPLSLTETIKVKLIEPEYKEDTETLKISDTNTIEWFYMLEPGEEVEIPLSFSVEYPKAIEIKGL